MASRLDDLIREHAERLDQLAGPIALTDVTRGSRYDTVIVTLIDSELTPTQPDSARRWPVIAVAAALVAIAVGGLMLATGDEDSSSKVPADQHSTNVVLTVAPPTAVAPRRVTDAFEPQSPRITYIVPDGWYGGDSSVWKYPNRQLGVSFVNADDTFLVNCPSSTDDASRVGPTVDDLVSALANLPGVHAETRAVTIDGFDGKQIELTFPSHYDGEECSPNFSARREGIPLYFRCSLPRWCDSLVQAVLPNQHQKIWVLDVDGSRLVIMATSFPDTSQQDRADQDEIVASIQIG